MSKKDFFFLVKQSLILFGFSPSKYWGFLEFLFPGRLGAVLLTYFCASLLEQGAILLICLLPSSCPFSWCFYPSCSCVACRRSPGRALPLELCSTPAWGPLWLRAGLGRWLARAQRIVSPGAPERLEAHHQQSIYVRKSAFVCFMIDFGFFLFPLCARGGFVSGAVNGPQCLKPSGAFLRCGCGPRLSAEQYMLRLPLLLLRC